MMICRVEYENKLAIVPSNCMVEKEHVTIWDLGKTWHILSTKPERLILEVMQNKRPYRARSQNGAMSCGTRHTKVLMLRRSLSYSYCNAGKEPVV